jgi:RNA polymerase sigma factor (sigma-70 family)
MAASPSRLFHHLHRLLAPHPPARDDDATLLERFARHRDQSAFAALVSRHGPLVLRLCRRVLADAQAAEDAFQAVFLVLARQAAGLRLRESLPAWLHGVAWRVACKARAADARRRQREAPAPELAPADPHPDPLAELSARELLTALDEEVRRLPEAYRLPVLLCGLEGHTQEEAAGLLGWTVGSVKGRLERGRKRLHLRLARRGLTLSAALAAVELSRPVAAAGVPSLLARATIQHALLFGAGQAAAGAGRAPAAAALAEGVLKTMAANKCKMALLAVLAVGLAGLGLAVCAYHALAQKPGNPGKPTASGPARAKDQKPNPRQAPEPRAEPRAADKMTVGGKVLDPAGKPAAGADVAVIAWATNPNRVQRSYARWHVLGSGKTNAQGAFRLAVPRTSRRRYASACALARAAGHGLARADFDPDAARPEVRLRLPREQAVHGRLIDLQGKGAAGVQVFATALQSPPAAKQSFYVMSYIIFSEPPQGLPPWPATTTTDARGRFTLRGLGPDWAGTVQARDGRFARQEFEFQPAGSKGAKPLTGALAPAQILEGTVTYGDTGKPVPHARLMVFSMPEPRPGGLHIQQMGGKADATGRFRLAPFLGAYHTVLALPPPGTPYLSHRKQVRWPKADVTKQEVQLSLIRGILVRGRITEKPSGKPVAGASVSFVQNRTNNRFYRDDTGTSWDEVQQVGVSDKDGNFQLPVLPGPNHLLVCGPTPDYVKVETSLKKIEGLPTNADHRYYLDAVVPLNLKPQPGPHQAAITLHRGVTLTGKVLDPDGKPVAKGLLLCRYYFPREYSHNNMARYAKEFKDGRFELPGCDPDRATEVFFLDVAHQLGAVVQLSPKELRARPATVRLRRCGTAKVRLVDDKGQPLANVRCHVDLVITPGIPWADSFRQKGMLGETAFLSSLDRKRHEDLRSNARGLLTLPTLIPGATHWLYAMPRGRGMVYLKGFKAEAGKTIDFGDVPLKEPN